MGDVRDTRRLHVKTLRQIVRKSKDCGVELIVDSAGREKVEAFAEAIQSSGQVFQALPLSGDPPQNPTWV